MCDDHTTIRGQEAVDHDAGYTRWQGVCEDCGDVYEGWGWSDGQVFDWEPVEAFPAHSHASSTTTVAEGSKAPQRPPSTAVST